MLAIIAKVRVKPDQIARFMQFIEADAAGSLQDEPGCVRFEVLRDEASPHVYYMYEIYRDEAAYAVHQRAPYFQAVFAAAEELFDGPPEGFKSTVVFPRAPDYWAKR